MKDYKDYYCRTENGIKKIQKYEKEPQYENCHCIWFADNDYGTLLTDEEFEKMKPSETLIDLIEIGDYVNGWRITTIDKRNNKLYSEYEDGYLIKRIKDKNIERIVTKEQMKAMQYEVK